MNRRQCLKTINGLGLLSMVPETVLKAETLLRRTIPSTGEQLTAVGCGTWRTFDVGSNASERSALKSVVKNLIEKGGRVIDSSPMYGRSEGVIGDVSSEAKLNEKLFVATKVWTSGRESGIRQMNESMNLLRRSKIDLMQVHNLTDWETHLKTLRDWKSQGRIRYIGVTHYLDSMHDTLADIISKEKPDFVQVNYNLSDRHADQRLLGTAMDRGVAVIINRPFQEGAMFGQVNGKKLPSLALDLGCRTWAQFFLKFILSQPAVTCTIPGTSNPLHMIENIEAAQGIFPNEKQRDDMYRLFNS
jgi:diketogulonate reductase-like aldo/keto reductase